MFYQYLLDLGVLIILVHKETKTILYKIDSLYSSISIAPLTY